MSGDSSALSFIPERVAGPYGTGGEGAKIARMVAAATVGGTASAIGGGKFANGAWTAAFVSRFNHDGVETVDRYFARLRIQRVLHVAYDTYEGLSLEFEPANGFRIQKVGDKYMISQGALSLTVDENKVSGGGLNWMRGRTHAMSVHASVLSNGQLSIKGSYSYSSIATLGVVRAVGIEGMVMNSSGLVGNAARAIHGQHRTDSNLRAADCQVTGDCP